MGGTLCGGESRMGMQTGDARRRFHHLPGGPATVTLSALPHPAQRRNLARPVARGCGPLRGTGMAGLDDDDDGGGNGAGRPRRGLAAAAYLDSTCPAGSSPVVSASHAACQAWSPGSNWVRR